MKKRYFTVIAGIMLSAAVVTGCAGRTSAVSEREAELEEEISELRREIDELRNTQTQTADDPSADTAQGNGEQNSTDSGSGNQNQTGSDDTVLSFEEARDIALARVEGATAANISIELDRDDGWYVYEGEIFYNGMEYEFEIDAGTGNILKWEEERW